MQCSLVSVATTYDECAGRAEDIGEQPQVVMCMKECQVGMKHMARQLFCPADLMQSHCPRKADVMCAGPGEDVEERPQLGHLHGGQRG